MSYLTPSNAVVADAPFFTSCFHLGSFSPVFESTQENVLGVEAMETPVEWISVLKDWNVFVTSVFLV
jgi:hypothetical protein